MDEQKANTIRPKVVAMKAFIENVTQFGLSLPDDETRSSYSEMYQDIKLALDDPKLETYAPPLPRFGSYGDLSGRANLRPNVQASIVDGGRRLIAYIEAQLALLSAASPVSTRANNAITTVNGLIEELTSIIEAAQRDGDDSLATSRLDYLKSRALPRIGEIIGTEQAKDFNKDSVIRSRSSRDRVASVVRECERYGDKLTKLKQEIEDDPARFTSPEDLRPVSRTSGGRLVMDQVFLSHASEDDELSARIASLLNERAGLLTFSSGPGRPVGLWSDEVRAALEESDHFWLLATNSALERSVYVHHELGYFFGFHRARSPESELLDVGRRLGYVIQSDDDRRPGMLQHIQSDSVEDFDDPVVMARTIAQRIGVPFEEPENPEALRLTGSGWTARAPSGLEDLRIRRASSSAASDYAYGIVAFRIESPRTMFNVSAIAWHPKVTFWPLATVPQISGSQSTQINLKVEWAVGEQPPEELIDSYQRHYSYERPRDQGPEWHPLYLTFETESAEVWAAVTYVSVERQSHGHPETSQIPAFAPFGWVRGKA